MVQKSGVTLKDILMLDCMKNVTVVAGHAGLDRIVTNVNVMEVPDIGEWIHPGDLLITTAYSIRDNIEAQTTLVPQLASKGLAGLALKPKRYLENIPEAMINQADTLGFPLLELPRETSFSDIINPILSEILQTHTIYFQKSEAAHRLFMEVVLKGGTIEDITDTLAQSIDNSVIIFDQSNRIAAKSLVGCSDTFLFKQLEQLHDQTDVTIIDPLDSGVKYYKTQVASDPPLHEYRTDIVARGQKRGFLSIWDNNRPITQNDFIFIDRAMAVAALEILNEKSVTEIERRYRNEFLDDLLNESRSIDILTERAHYFNWDLSLNYTAYVIDIDNFRGYTARVHKDEQAIQQAKEQLFYNVVQAVSPEERFIAGTKSDSIILLIAQPEGYDPKKTKDYFNRRADELLRAIEKNIKEFTVSIGVGRLYPGVAGLRKSYSEAIKALRVGKTLLGQNQIIAFDRLGIYRLLEQVGNFEELEAFYKETILPLDRYDKSGSSDLVKTLDTYFKCTGNLRQVSKTLFTHYNTILYRMERIEEITGLDLKSPEDRLNLLIGLKIRRILNEKGKDLG